MAMASMRSSTRLPPHPSRMPAQIALKLPLPHRPPNVCVDCWEGPFANQFGLLGSGYSYLVSRDDLENRANLEGCIWCQIVLAALQDSVPGAFRVEDDLLTLPTAAGKYTLFLHKPSFMSMMFYMTFASQTSHLQHKHRFVCWAAQGDPAADFLLHDDYLLDVGSQRSLDLAKQCMDRCKHEHELCCHISAHPYPMSIPARLVDCADPRSPLLVQTAGRAGIEAYVALSYVWGVQTPSYRTTTENLPGRINGAPLTGLPRTVQDAIRVTHALGFRYLWVDGLCIVQDSPEDSYLEIKHMHRIYRYAALTIIAASASSVDEGFLQERTEPPTLVPMHTLPFICPGRPDNLASTALTGTRQLGIIHVKQKSRFVEDAPAPEPVDYRAWCSQELLMSPRSLIFTHTGLLFRCRTTSVNVCGAVHDNLFDPRPLHHELFQPNPSTDPGPELRTFLWRAWWQTVHSYGRRSTSCPNDRLAVCGGVAEEFGRVLHTNYLAGLWRDSLPRDLLWYKDRRTVRLPRPAYRAPSWSWAALDGQIGLPHPIWSLPEEGGDEFAKVVACSVRLEKEALPFGQVTGGSLVLCVPLIRCAWGDVDEDGERRVLLQTAEQAKEGKHGSSDEDCTIGDHELCGWGLIDSEADATVTPLWAAPILRDEDGDPHFLILALATPEQAARGTESDAGRTVYQRVGHFYTLQSVMEKLGWGGGLPHTSEIVIV
ncbi:heterokaryon incompatibility protein-domain-containing protein [Trametes polyzona]|nr:heterokaryon incompatibility protein-domain-containing protein [Trametes polyzona]